MDINASRHKHRLWNHRPRVDLRIMGAEVIGSKRAVSDLNFYKTLHIHDWQPRNGKDTITSPSSIARLQIRIALVHEQTYLLVWVLLSHWTWFP